MATPNWIITYHLLFFVVLDQLLNYKNEHCLQRASLRELEARSWQTFHTQNRQLVSGDLIWDILLITRLSIER